MMHVVLKRVLIAAALMVVCASVLAATKSYGVWVISAIAVFLFFLGLRRKDESADKTSADQDATGKQPDEGETP